MTTAVKTIGIIGAGQLGLMIAEQARLLGVRTVCLDPSPEAPAFAVSDERIVAAYDDAEALERLCRMSDAVTYEFENVPGEILIPLCGKYDIPQGYEPLYDSQDRLREKTNAREHGLRTPEFAAVDDEASLRAAVARLGLPAVLKTRTLGYDGHGQRVLKSEADIGEALPLLAVPCILEEFVRFDYEASIVMVADDERVVSFPIGRNIHRDGILDLCVVPAEADAEVLSRMKSESERFMRACGYRGHSGHRILRAGGCDLLQRDGAAPPQFGPLHDRGVHDQPVPRAGPLPAGHAARGPAPRGAHGDEEYPRTGSRGGRTARRRAA